MSHTGRKAATLQQQTSRRRAWLWVAVGGTVLLLGGILLLQPAARDPLVADDDPTLGSGPVDVFYFADFQCPYCQEFELTRLDGLRAEFLDAGRARLVFKDLPIIGPDSEAAAQASQAVWAQGPEVYWAWHRHVFEAQGPERSGWAAPEQLVRLSAEVPGVDADAVRAALDDARYADEVRADRRQASDAGVRATPTLVVDGRVLNALDTPAVRAAIEEAERR